jgi:nitroreductase
MKLKHYAAQNPLVTFIRLLAHYWQESLLFSRGLAQSNTRNNCNKFKAGLMMKFHAIEKGLSTGGTRAGFGQGKIISALEELSDFYCKFDDREFVLLNLSIVDKYIKFNKEMDIEIPGIIGRTNMLLDLITVEQQLDDHAGGVVVKKHSDVLNSIHSAFPEFSNSRYSIRDFNSDERVDKQKIYEAFEIAMKTPSACNRQPWRIHLFSGDKKNRLLEFQGGCNGFVNSMEYAILLTADLNSYFINEINQPYVDGGLYGMNLLYALHYTGLATIPLTTGFKQKKTKTLKRKFNIPACEVPVMIIGIGSYKHEYKVAVSHRIDYTNYLKEH